MSNAMPRNCNTANTAANTAAEFWSTRREASLNWLALGLLLAAWNASNNDVAVNDTSANARRRPEALRGYAHVSVRAASRVTARAGQ
jgi:hypothetical protein